MKKLGKYFLITLSVILFLIIGLILSLRTPYVQQKITNYATSYVSDKTNTTVNIDRLFITFLGAAQIEGVYLEDQQKDTLLYAKAIEIDVAWAPLLDGFFRVKRAALTGIVGNLYNNKQDSSYNYQFLIDAFAKADSTSNQAASNKSASDTSSVPFSIDEINLKNIRFSYADVFTEMETSITLQSLYTTVDSLDFNSLLFDVNEFNLDGVVFNYSQEKASMPSDDTTKSTLPTINVNQLALANLQLSYSTLYDSLWLKSKLNKVGISQAKVNLNKQQVTSNKVALNADLFSLQLSAAAADTTVQNTQATDTTFNWPNWNINIGQLDFQMDKLAIDQGKAPTVDRRIFTPSHLHYKSIEVHTQAVKFAPKNIHLNRLNATLASENNAFILNKLQSNIELTDQGLSVDKLVLHTANSYLESSQQLTYPNLETLFAADFEKIDANIALKVGTTIDLKDAYYFSPELRKVSIYDSIAQEKIKIYGQLKGNSLKTTINQLYVMYGEHSNIQLSGNIQNWMTPDQLVANIEKFQLNGFVKDFHYLLPESYAKSYPQQLKISGSATYSPQKAVVNIEGLLDQKSEIALKGKYSFNKPNKYDVLFTGNKLAIDKWLQDSVNLSPINLKIKADGSGIEWPELKTSANIEVNGLKYKDNLLDTLTLALQIQNGKLDLSSEYADDILKYNLQADGTIDSSTQKINLKLDVDKLNLNAFALSDSIAYLQTTLSATALIDSLSQSVSLNVSELSFANQQNYFELSPLNLDLLNGEDSSGINFNWEKIALNLNLNQPLRSLSNLQLNQQNLMSLSLFKSDSIYRPISLSIDLDAALSNQVSALLEDQLSFEPIKMRANYASQDKTLDLLLEVPALRYNQISVDSLALSIDADSANLELTNTINKIDAGFINIFTTKINAKINSEAANFNLNMKDDLGDSLFILNAEANNKADSLLWSIDTNTLILNGEKWDIDEKNYFYIGKEHFLIRYMAFQRKQESFFIETQENQDLHGLHVSFQDFNVGNLIAILNPEEVILSGILNGDIKLADLSNPLNFKAEIGLKEMKIFEKPAGKIELTTSQVAVGEYELRLTTTGPLDMTGNGTVNTNSEQPQFDLSLKLNDLSLPFITIFTEGLIQEAEGSLSGDLTISGTPEDFNYKGDLKFKDATLFITELNTSFSLPNEQISMNNSTIQLKTFTILDKQQHKLIINGTVKTDDLLNPAFDLKLNADNFQLMNKQKQANSLYYGTAFIDAEATVTGTLVEPVVRADLKINDNTDFTYVVPTSTVDIVRMEGVVKFKSPYEAIDSLKNKSDSTPQNLEISGIDLSALIKTDKNAKFKVIVDERRGDYLVVSGESDLNFELGKNGDMNLTGNYLVNDGFYQLSLYDLVKRKFEITSGSQVKWYGDPMEAGLNITANYNLETSPSSLIINQNVSNKKLPFIVELFVNGSLSAPEISFGLSMPQDQRGALGGRVYQQIQAINNNETELNKQVFSLLVLNQFFPAGSTGEGPDSEVLARNSASQILTNQLNKLSSQYIKGVDLNLDLDSYKATENGAAEQKTQLGLSLSKSLFDDRFKVQVGSQFELEGEQRGKQSATDILGNVMIQYLLTEDGRYILTGYRKNEYEGLIDGQVTVTGISIQFNKEFEKFSDLLNNDKNNSDEE